MLVNLNNNAEKVEDVNVLKNETIDSMREYIPGLTEKLESMVDELVSNIQEDSWEYLRMMIDGLNWVIEAYNCTLEVYKDKVNIDNDEVQEGVDLLSDVYGKKDAAGTSEVLKNRIIPFLKLLMTAF